jgi:DNA-binding CsgD family transcriptional regulator
MSKQILTQRELQVLHLLAAGRTSREIGEQLGITFLTAQTHRRNMLRKLNLDNSQQLVGWGFQQKILK